MPLPDLVLASSSSYRKALIARLGLDCRSLAPDIDERALDQERPVETAMRLAVAKARKIATDAPAALIIGSDQVAVLGDTVLGKPGTHAAAAQQLRAMSGRSVVFHTALCLLDAATDAVQVANVPTTVQMRELDAALIERYLRRDQPYDCAGSAKIEALGIALVENVKSDDPTALIGLPLIALVSMLKRAGVVVP
ncbi:MAG: Maf family nucleotide pyrophosphatase [Betaproteobacteria bacterium]|jgi:septum formation protein|nr:Maf family nucleotide pyrophosphatase [Betaproteobacteria bacterium]MDH5342266.1 Maf family nucleotide pyrophosphatase [Betaproteobacteria bacterium]